MDDVKRSQQAVRQRPIFFIENAGQTVESVLGQRVSTLEKKPTSALVCDEVTYQLTNHVHFAKGYYTEHYLNDNQPQYYAYRQPLGCMQSIEAVIRQQLRSPFNLLTSLEKNSWSTQKFLLLWTLIHSLVCKADFFIQYVFLSHADDRPRDIIIQESESYHSVKNAMHNHLENIPRDVHRLFLQCSIASILPDRVKHFLLVLDLVESAKGLVLRSTDLVPLRVSAKMQILQQLSASNAEQGAEELEQQLLNATPDVLFTLWKQSSYRFCRYRHRLTRHLDQLLFTYANSVRNQPQQTVECLLQELVLLYRLQHGIALWLNERQYVSSRTDTIWTLQRWAQQRFATCAHDFLTVAYYDHKVMQEVKYQQLFTSYGQQIVQFLD